MGETYVKVSEKWRYLYRAVDKAGKTADFMLSEKRNGNEPVWNQFYELAAKVRQK